MSNILYRLRRERGVPASTIARILDVEINHVYRIERGDTTLIPENMDLICKAFNIDHSYFLTNHESEDTDEKTIPAELYNELLRVKNLSPKAINSVINFIKFQISEIDKNDFATEHNKDKA